MPTDDERRRVAKALRDFLPIDLVAELADVDCHLSTMVMGDKFCPGNCLECFETVCERLAYLIETNCDREALLALAGQLDSLGLNGFSSGWSSGAVNVGSFARRIREACGEVDA